MRKMESVVVGLIRGRHEMPVDKYIFDEDIMDMFDYEGIFIHICDYLRENVGVDYDREGYVRLYRGKKAIIVYVTGLTAVSCALVDACNRYGISLTLMHYDRDKDCYHNQCLSTGQSLWCPSLE